MSTVTSTLDPTPNFQQVASTLPITALGFLPSTHISESLLLSGEGPICNLYSPSTGQLLHTRRIFFREAVRGIAFEEPLDPSPSAAVPQHDADEDDEDMSMDKRRIVFWGGHRIVVTTLEELIEDSPASSAAASLANLPPTFTPGSTTASYVDEQGFKETPVKDFVHYAFFISRPGGSLVGVVTSHNLLLLYDPVVRRWVGERDMGERCILYSATGIYVPDGSSDEGRVIVAAGTVFGEILVWSAPIDPPPKTQVADSSSNAHSRSHSIDSETWTELASDSEGEGWEELTKSTMLGSRAGTPKGNRCKGKKGVELHYRLKGHEGSIFGVDISSSFDLGEGRSKRFLVSCSDDRTARVWDISKVDECDEDTENDGKLAEALAWDELGVDELRGTGFTITEGTEGNEESKSDCVAIGWGHQARIWNCRFLQKLSYSMPSTQGKVNIITTSEDLTSKVWEYTPFASNTVTTTAAMNPSNAQNITELACLSTTLLHSGKNVFALAISEIHHLLATGGHDGRIAVVSYDTGTGDTKELERYAWELDTLNGKDAEMELEAIERDLAGLNIIPAKSPLNTSEATVGKSKTSTDQFRNYAIVDSYRYVICTSKGYLALYTFPDLRPSSHRVTANPGGWRTLGQWDNLGGASSVAAWEGSGLVAAQDRSGMVGIIDLDDLSDGGDEEGYNRNGKKGRWWHAGEGTPGPMFCGRHGDLFYLLTTSLVTPEVRLHLFPDPRVSCPSIRNSPLPPPRTKTIILCLPSNFHSPTSYHLDFAQGLLFLGSRSGILSVFDVWSGVDADIMLNPLESWKGWFDKDAITGILAYPTQAVGLTRQQQESTDPRLPAAPTFSPIPGNTALTRGSRIITTGRNGVYAIVNISLTPAHSSSSSTSHITLTKLHIKKLLNGGSIEGTYHRIPSGSDNSSKGDLLFYGFRGKSFFVWNETRGYEVMSEECGGGHRSWIFHPNKEGEGVGWFVWTQAGRMYALRSRRAKRHLLQMGGHGREIKAIAVSPPVAGGGYRLIATGAEDTLIRLSILRPQRTEKGKRGMVLKGVAVFKRHTTGIQYLGWSSCGDYLFSSGGVEEFYVWRVRRLDTTDNAGSGSNKTRETVGVVCVAACPLQSVVPDLRIMGFDVSTVGVTWTEEGRGKAFLITMVYSDSSIKVWLYDPGTKVFRLVIQGKYKTSCLLHVSHYIHRKESWASMADSKPESGMHQYYDHSLEHQHYQQNSGGKQHDSTFLLFIAGTDGHVSAYDITNPLRKAGISITPLGATRPPWQGDMAGNNTSPQLLPSLVARSDLLNSPPLPTQLLPSPPHAGWTTKIHQSSIKSMAILPLDVRHQNSASTSSRDVDYGVFRYNPPEKISVVLLTGGDDTAFAVTVFTLFTWDESYQIPGNLKDTKSTTTWVTRTVPEAHASAITAVALVRRCKTRWTGDVDSEPVKEVSLGVVTVGVERVLRGWDVSLLMGAEEEMKVVIKEAAGGARGYSPVADVSGAAVLENIVVDGDPGEKSVEGARVVVVGVGMDVWDVAI